MSTEPAAGHASIRRRRFASLARGSIASTHGSASPGFTNAEAAREALRRAGGKWKDNRQFQAHTRENPDKGWLDYLAKDDWKKQPWLKALAQGKGFAGTQISGKDYSVTDGLRDLAQADYDWAKGKWVYGGR